MVAKVSPLAVPKFLTALDRSPDAVRLLVIEHRAEFAHVEPATARFTHLKSAPAHNIGNGMLPLPNPADSA
jgi:hypothetical protein